MKPTIVGPPGYASPNPDTARGQLVALEAHPRRGDLSDSYGADLKPHIEVETVSPIKVKTAKKKGTR